MYFGDADESIDVLAIFFAFGHGRFVSCFVVPAHEFNVHGQRCVPFGEVFEAAVEGFHSAVFGFVALGSGLGIGCYALLVGLGIGCYALVGRF